MAKEKKSKSTSLPQKHVHLRLAFLRQAASHLADRERDDIRRDLVMDEDQSQTPAVSTKTDNAQPRHIINQMKGVSRKAVVRLHRDTKRSICKRCDEVLIEGMTAVKRTENKSANRARPWADVHIIECKTCGALKRFPVDLGCPREKAGDETHAD